MNTETSTPTSIVEGREGRGKYPSRFAKGNKLQPIGGHRSPSLVTILQRQLRDNPNDAESIVAQLIKLGKKGSIVQLNAIKEIFDRTDGKATETIHHEGELPITLMFVPASKQLDSHSPKQLGPGESID